jgi:hypothetical protein
MSNVKPKEIKQLVDRDHTPLNTAYFNIDVVGFRGPQLFFLMMEIHFK